MALPAFKAVWETILSPPVGSIPTPSGLLKLETFHEQMKIEIPIINLRWTPWHNWESLKADERDEDRVFIPNKVSGVYEVRRRKQIRTRLTIGKTTNLCYRIRYCLVKGVGKHSAGKRIRENEDVKLLEVRWAKTDRPSAVEEELHIKYKKRFETLPIYTKRT